MLTLFRSREEQAIVELALRQQLRETFPDETTHRYLIYGIYGIDAIFSPAVASAIKNFEMDPKRTAFRSPWQNGTAERVVGSVRRETLDQLNGHRG